MERETSWSKEGRRLGRQEGRQEEALLIVSKMLSRRFGAVGNLMLDRLKNLTTEELEGFTDELIDSRDVAGLEQWLELRGH